MLHNNDEHLVRKHADNGTIDEKTTPMDRCDQVVTDVMLSLSPTVHYASPVE